MQSNVPENYPLSWVGNEARWNAITSDYAEIMRDMHHPVLDMASGPEPFAGRFFRMGDIISQDINPQYCRTAHIQGYNTVFSDMRTLPFKGQLFRTVIMRHALTHAAGDDAVVVLAEAYRVLSPGGRCFIEALGLEDMRAAKGHDMGGGTMLRTDGRVWQFYSTNGLSQMARRIGFDIVSAEERKRPLPKLQSRRHVIILIVEK